MPRCGCASTASASDSTSLGAEHRGAGLRATRRRLMPDPAAEDQERPRRQGLLPGGQDPAAAAASLRPGASSVSSAPPPVRSRRGGKQVTVRRAGTWKAPHGLGVAECFVVQGERVERGTYCYLAEPGPTIGLLARAVFPSGTLELRDVKTARCARARSGHRCVRRRCRPADARSSRRRRRRAGCVRPPSAGHAGPSWRSSPSWPGRSTATTTAPRRRGPPCSARGRGTDRQRRRRCRRTAGSCTISPSRTYGSNTSTYSSAGPSSSAEPLAQPVGVRVDTDVRLEALARARRRRPRRGVHRPAAAARPRAAGSTGCRRGSHRARPRRGRSRSSRSGRRRRR